MMINNNYLKLILILIFFSLSFIASDCTKEENPVSPGGETGDGVTATYTSSTGGTLNHNEFSLVVEKGDVPKLSTGADGTVIFSINTSDNIESGIPNVPAGYTVIGKYLKAGPEAFSFERPIQILFPASGESSPQGLTVLNYSPDTQSWKIVPTSTIDTINKRIGIDVLTLGYFVLTKNNSMSDASDFRQGGCVLDMQEPFTNFILTVASANPEKPAILGLYANGFIGGVYSGPIFLGCPEGKTKAIVPQGTISFWVTKSLCVGNEVQIFTYTIPASVTVSEPLQFVGWRTYDAIYYVPFTIPPGGSWVAGRPGTWPPPTVPFGSGTFQATLTWVNSAGSIADLDLHLYGPNGLHVYYSARTSANFSLDRDWTDPLGNAIENIFSTTPTIPAGNYEVKVKNYRGVTKSFNVRTILNGTSSNYSGTLSENQEVTARTFTIQ